MSEIQMVKNEETTDHENDYERVIFMLESSLDKELELSAQEYQRYMQDDWHWKKTFNQRSAKYSG